VRELLDLLFIFWVDVGQRIKLGFDVFLILFFDRDLRKHFNLFLLDLSVLFSEFGQLFVQV
jgi:hypothetical protein